MARTNNKVIKNNKAVSQVLFIIIAAVIFLVAAAILIYLFSGTTKDIARSNTCEGKGGQCFLKAEACSKDQSYPVKAAAIPCQEKGKRTTHYCCLPS